MPSKKASFESKDPSYAAANSADSKENNSKPSNRASFESRDASPPAGASVDYTTGDAKRATPAGRATFESRDLSHTDSAADSTAPSDNRVADKASFYARDPDLGSDDESKPDKKKYMGVERRKVNRRSGRDRRSDVRFDLDKNDRRQNEGRRADDHTPKYW